MSSEHRYCVANAYLDTQITIIGGWDPRQYIALELADWDGILEPVEYDLIIDEARDLALRLLMLSERAFHRAREEQR